MFTGKTTDVDIIKWLAILALAVATYFLKSKLKNQHYEKSPDYRPDFRIRSVGIFYKPNTQMFPQHWFAPPINARVEPLDESQLGRTTAILQNAFAKYPQKMDLHLREVYVFKSMYFYGIPFGGTYKAPVWNKLYITNDHYLDVFVERIIHAELSSVLFKTYPEYLDQKTWLSVLPQGFSYANSQTHEVATLPFGELLEQIDTDMLKRGFLTYYATTSLENDFNSIVKQLFRPSEIFWQYLEHYPGIKSKTYLVISFYNRLNPEFDETYFKKLVANETTI